MIYLNQLIYLIDGKEAIFDEFESISIPIISKYNGRLTLRIRPNEESVIENNTEVPYEIHFIEFESEEDFEQFKKDEVRKKFLHLKEKSIRSSILIQCEKL